MSALQDKFQNDADTTIGDYSYGSLSVGRSYGGCKLTVGKFCSFGSGVLVAFWGKHQYRDITTFPFNMLHSIGFPPVQCTEVKGEDVIIGNDVWIANNALIMQGAVIDDGAVIGAHSVVGGHVSAYSLAVGNPCRVVRPRFAESQITKLLAMKWWNWDIETIKKHLQLICSPNIDQLYEIWEKEIE